MDQVKKQISNNQTNNIQGFFLLLKSRIKKILVL